MTCESYVSCVFYAFKMRTDSFKKNMINDPLRIDKCSKERVRGVWVWPTSRLTFGSPLLEKVREGRVGKRSHPTGRNLARKPEEGGCAPKREPARRLVGLRQRRYLLDLRKGNTKGKSRIPRLLLWTGKIALYTL